jgi:hypothetical protein
MSIIQSAVYKTTHTACVNPSDDYSNAYRTRYRTRKRPSVQDRRRLSVDVLVLGGKLSLLGLDLVRDVVLLGESRMGLPLGGGSRSRLGKHLVN